VPAFASLKAGLQFQASIALQGQATNRKDCSLRGPQFGSLGAAYSGT